MVGWVSSSGSSSDDDDASATRESSPAPSVAAPSAAASALCAAQGDNVRHTVSVPSTPLDVGARRSLRDTTTRTPLDAYADERAVRAHHQTSGTGSPGLTRHPCQVDGADCLPLAYRVENGTICSEEGTRVLKSAFANCDENMMMLRGQYKEARRFILLREERVVAVAVAFAHYAQGVLEVPMLGVANGQRHQGHGTLLVAIAMQLAAAVRLTHLVVSATKEAERFWLARGLHIGTNRGTHSDEVGAVIRRLRAHDLLHAGEGTTVMGRRVDPACAESALRQALQRIRSPAPQAEEIGAEEAELRCNYRDLTLKKEHSFFRRPDGTKEEAERWKLPPEHYFKAPPYADLRAFQTGDKGWGVRCRSSLKAGQVIVEILGQWLSEDEYNEAIAAQAEKYLVGFSDETLERKRASGDKYRYIDCMHFGNMMRLLNDCREAPNCEIMCVHQWPSPVHHLLPTATKTWPPLESPLPTPTQAMAMARPQDGRRAKSHVPRRQA